MLSRLLAGQFVATKRDGPSGPALPLPEFDVLSLIETTSKAGTCAETKDAATATTNTGLLVIVADCPPISGGGGGAEEIDISP